MPEQLTDLFVIGGGINGTGIALDAAGRGLSVRLAEQQDLAEETSSYSSKLIHGGLRYLEYYEFRLVREALKEREVLMGNAPHLIHPLRILMPHTGNQRPRWLVRLGLYLYDHLDWHQTLPKSKGHKIHADQSDEPLNDASKYAYAYSDCTVDDARYVVHLALAAQEKGADILTRHQVTNVKRLDKHFEITVLNTNTQETKRFHSKAVVNAAGPWVDDIIKNKAHAHSKHHVRLIKGSHLIVNKLYDGDQAYILQNDDNRIVFAIPYRDDFTLIGTTDVPYTDDPHKANIDPDEIQYLFKSVNQYFKKQISEKDIVWSYSGVRPLQADEHDDPSKVTRDYTFEIDEENGLPMLSIFGGKITTYRRLSEHAVNDLQKYFPEMGKTWTHEGKLPGGNIESFDSYIEQLQNDHPFLDHKQAHRIAYAYGSRAKLWLKDAENWNDLGEHFGHGLTEAEVRFLMETEWAQTLDDIIWRRSKMILRLDDSQKERLKAFLQA